MTTLAWRLPAPVAVAALFLGGCAPNPAREALARCEAAGDAYAASKAAYETASDEYQARRTALLEKKERESGFAALVAASDNAYAEYDTARAEAGELFRAAKVAATERGMDDYRAARMAERDAKVREAQHKEADAYEVFQAANQALDGDLELRIREEVDQETEVLRELAESLERRMDLDNDLLKRAIVAANEAREPGGPVCTWYITNRDLR